MSEIGRTRKNARTEWLHWEIERPGRNLYIIEYNISRLTIPLEFDSSFPEDREFEIGEYKRYIWSEWDKGKALQEIASDIRAIYTEKDGRFL